MLARSKTVERKIFRFFFFEKINIFNDRMKTNADELSAKSEIQNKSSINAIVAEKSST